MALILSQIILVISSPSRSQTGFATLILEAKALLAKADLFRLVDTLESMVDVKKDFKLIVWLLNKMLLN